MRRGLALAVALLLVLGGCSDAGDGEGGGIAAGDALDEEPPSIADHWHVALGLSRCGEELPPLEDVMPDTTGIHSHDDGLIHVHPLSTAVAGEGATLGAFFEAVGVEVTDEGVVAPAWTLPFEGECDGEPATLTVTLFAAGGELSSTTFATAELLPDVHLSPDGTSIVLAFAPGGVDGNVQLPPSAPNLAAPAP